MIDTHAHLEYGGKYSADLDAVILRAREAGVDTIINIGGDNERNRKAIEIAEAHENIYVCPGIFPLDLDHDNLDEQLSELKEIATSSDKVVGIGECGLDYYKNNFDRDLQKEGFRRQLSLADDLNLPVIVHARDSYNDVLEVLLGDRFVIHSFAGTKKHADEFMKLGGIFSFNGIITFPNANDIRELVKYIPLEKIMLETDSPFLAPQKYRGDRNEPAYVVEVAKQVAEIKGISLEDVERVTDEVAQGFFGF